MKNLIPKKIKQVGILVGALLLILSVLPSNLLGVTKVNAESSQTEVNQELTNFQTELDSKLAQANKIYSQAQEAQEKVKQSKSKITEYESKIAETENDIVQLKASVAKQMRAVQSNGGATFSYIDVVASSKNLSEMITRLTNLNVVLTAEADQAKSLIEKEASLKTMKVKLEETQESLVKNQNEQKARDEALAKSVAEVKAKAEQEKAKISSSSSSTQNSSSSSSQSSQASSDKGTDSANNGSSTTTSGGRTLNVEATAYALNGITATGIDLSKNPICIAVDPSVIPLNSLVEVPGYGIAIAGDTGGAIIGNIIDVHFPTNDQAIAWGRKNIQITVLS